MVEKKQAGGSVLAINVSQKKSTVKESVSEVVLDKRGIIQDAHAGSWHRQVSMLARESIDEFNSKYAKDVTNGAFAENITTCGIDLHDVKILDRFIVGETELEVTQLGKTCHAAGCAIFSETGDYQMPTEGIFLRVVKGGKILPGDRVIRFPRIFRFKIITLSDKANVGEFDDTSGPGIEESLVAHFSAQGRRIETDYRLLPDDEEELSGELLSIVNSTFDAIFTTGGTGIGPRDITPDVVAPLCDKLIPGVMENIRMKYGGTNPEAYLSRSVCGVLKQTLIFTLPGSLKVVREYMSEILNVLEHMIFMVHGLGH